MVLPDDFNITRKPLIRPGSHVFDITDVQVQHTETEDGTVSYLNFIVIDEKQTQHDRLLSAPLSDTMQFTEKSRLALIMSRFGITIEENQDLNGRTINDLIGTRFKASVIYEGNFARIDERTIQPQDRDESEQLPLSP